MNAPVWIAATLVLGASLASPAVAGSDSCREWRAEHREWEGAVVRRFLRGAPQRQLDEAVFELLQREAWLTSCETSVRRSRAELVGWRLVGRAPDEYAGAVLESLLERAGFDVELDDWFGTAAPVEARRIRLSRGER